MIPTTTINKIILNANSQFDEKQLISIDRAFTEAVRTVRTLLPELPNADVVFYHNPEFVVPETGIGGNTDNEHTIFIPLDATHHFKQRDLLAVIRHELHHAVRMHKLGSTDSLLKKVISEGLADQFEREFDPNFRPVTYRSDISDEGIQMGLQDLKRIIKTGEYDYYEWFFGYGDYPNWFGYTLGNMIIEKYCAEHTTTPSKLVHVSADKFVAFIDTLVK